MYVEACDAKAKVLTLICEDDRFQERLKMADLQTSEKLIKKDSQLVDLLHIVGLKHTMKADLHNSSIK